MVGKWSIGVIVSLLGIMLADAKQETHALEDRVSALERDLGTIRVNTSETNAMMRANAARLDRMDDKIDAILDRLTRR